MQRVPCLQGMPHEHEERVEPEVRSGGADERRQVRGREPRVHHRQRHLRGGVPQSSARKPWAYSFPSFYSQQSYLVVVHTCAIPPYRIPQYHLCIGAPPPNVVVETARARVRVRARDCVRDCVRWAQPVGSLHSVRLRFRR